MPETCACPNPYWTWRLAACNEDGWACGNCRLKAAGEPPGYRPDLDREFIEEKVRAVLMALHDAELVYVSNSDQGEGIVGSVARECLRSGHLAQSSIAREIIGGMDKGERYKAQADAIAAGKDPRERCHCGKLATSYLVQGYGKPSIARCAEHSFWLESLKAEPRDPGAPEPPDPWEAFGDWVTAWRDAHPEDGRSELELIDEYGKEGAKP